MSDESGEGTATTSARAAMRTDLFDLSAPQPNYRKIIEDGGTVTLEGMTIVFSRQLVEHVVKNHDVFSSAATMSTGNVRPMIPLNIDPPRHTKFRKLLDPLFAPKLMNAMQDGITARVNRLIDAFIDRGECNFTDEFAELLPSSVFVGIAGMPEDDLPLLFRLRDGLMRPQNVDPAAATDLEVAMRVNQETGPQVYAYFDALLDEKLAHPADDVMTHLVHAEIDGEQLSREEMLDVCYLLLIAGLDTVSDALSCFWAYLVQHPEHRQQIVDDPSVIPNAVEELLRWESPVPGIPARTVTRDTELPNGMRLTAGSLVTPNIGAANVDPADLPDAFDVRFDRDVNRHLAFGGGVHRCLGSHLARLELRASMAEWHRRIPEYRLKPGHEKLEYPFGLRAVKDLTLTWDQPAS